MQYSESIRLTIVIPTLNEESALPATLQAIWDNALAPDQIEVLVVDAGSTDQTMRVAQKGGGQTFYQPSFIYKKYQSLNFGLEQARGKIVLFLDADTLLPRAFDQLIIQALSDQDTVGGAFEFSLDDQKWIFLFITWVNQLRYRLAPIYHGDQGLFCRRSIALGIDGFPPEPLMEAAFFSRKLKTKGKLTLIKSPVITSTRRFKHHGTWRVMWFDVHMWIRFILGFPVAAFAKKYWKKNICP